MDQDQTLAPDIANDHPGAKKDRSCGLDPLDLRTVGDRDVSCSRERPADDRMVADQGFPAVDSTADGAVRAEVEPAVHDKVAPDVAVGRKDKISGHPEVPVEDRSFLGEIDVA